MPDVTRSTYRDRLLREALVRYPGRITAPAEARWLDAVGAAERDLILGGVPMEA